MNRTIIGIHDRGPTTCGMAPADAARLRGDALLQLFAVVGSGVVLALELTSTGYVLGFLGVGLIWLAARVLWFLR